MSARWVKALALASPLLLGLACGGVSQSPARQDVDAEGVDAPVSRRRGRQAKAVNPADLPALSLDDILPPEPKAQDEGAGPAPEEGKPADAKAAEGKPGETEAAVPAPAEPEPEAAKPPDRNLFAFEEDPVIVEQRRKQAEEAAQKALEAAKIAAEARKKQEDFLREHPPPPQPPPIPFQFVGYFGRPEDRIGVFTGTSGQGIVLAKKGEMIFSSFKVVDIGYESAEIGFTGFKDTQRIPLAGGGK